MSSQSNSPLRLAELMASLSLAIDLGVGQPTEWVLRSCLLGLRISDALDMTEAERQQVYYLSLLRNIGCTSTAASDAALFGNELGVAELMTADTDNMSQTLQLLFRLVGQDQSLPRRVQMLARLIIGGPGVADSIHLAHCEVAGRLADRLGFDSDIQRAIWQIYERWDGRGVPNHLQGDDLLLPVRVVHLAQDAATFYAWGGIEAALEVAEQRKGRTYDPTLVDLFCQRAPDLLEQLKVESTWEAVLSAEPGLPIWLTDEQVETALQAIADFVDLKSPYTLGHSRAVAELAEAAAKQAGLPETDVAAVRQAAYVHDLGRVGVSAAIWCKQGALSESEWEQVRLHPYYTERILARCPQLANLGKLGALHHERLNGSGYHRGLTAQNLSPSARILAAANAYCALIEPRPHRPAYVPDEAADLLWREVREGRFDSDTVKSVLNTAGHRTSPPRRLAGHDLSQREIEVLRLLARGLSNRQMAKQLVISEKTVGHHVQHIYNKIGVSTRAGATLFAVQNYLLGD